MVDFPQWLKLYFFFPSGSRVAMEMKLISSHWMSFSMNELWLELRGLDDGALSGSFPMLPVGNFPL